MEPGDSAALSKSQRCHDEAEEGKTLEKPAIVTFWAPGVMFKQKERWNVPDGMFKKNWEQSSRGSVCDGGGAYGGT